MATRNSARIDAHHTPFAERSVEDRTDVIEIEIRQSQSMGATLANVERYDFRVSPETPASVLYAEFQRDPMLPGGIVADGAKVLGLLSRQRFFQQLSHRFGASLFLDAPVQKILGMGPPGYLALPEEMGIHEAARRCLARSRDSVFEPILVECSNGRVGLLGMHELLLAQSHQLTLAHDTIQGQIDAVEAASRAKSNFLANMSHEIRTPLNSIVGMTELLLDSNLSPRQREYAGTVIDSCENLLAIINDILDFSKIESGCFKLERLGFDLREHLGDTLKGLAVRACRQGIELAFRCAEDVPREIVGDPLRLRQILLNLVGNAIKFTHQGEVVVDVNADGREADQAVLHFRVMDTGIGIPDEKKALIFDAFEQADTSTTREYGGTGLGLAISRRLVNMMDGRLWVESEVGQGSTFHFTAAVGVRPEGEQGLIGSHDRAVGARVLVVDGHQTNRAILVEILTSWKMNPCAVGTAKEALAAIESAEACADPFALLIVDARLPDGSGFELAHAIRDRATAGDTPILTLIPADRSLVAEAERARISACLMKPVKQSELLNAILTVLGCEHEETCPVRCEDEIESDLPPLQILVGEDSLVNQKLTYEILTRRGHTVELAANGEEVLARIAERRFDIVLMDVQMPQMDGFEATRRIRQQQQTLGGHIPIVAMTAHALPDDRDRCLAAGMDAYVAKPIRVPVLLAAIADVLGHQKAAEKSCESALIATTTPASELIPEKRMDLEVHRTAVSPETLLTVSSLSHSQQSSPDDLILDWKQILHGLDGNAQVLRILIETTLDEEPRMMTAIRAAIDSNDATTLRLSAHKLKGVLRYFGETQAYLEAFHLEKMAHEGDLCKASETLQRLDAALVQVMRSVRAYLQSEMAENPCRQTALT